VTAEAPAARVVGVLAAAMGVLAVVTIVSWLLIAGVHADDSYDVHQVSGVWLTLASDVEHGVFYRPLYDGNAFGGTRYMPIQFLVYAGAEKVTGDRVVGAKIVVYTLAILLLGLVFASLYLLGCPLPVALGLVGVLLASGIGLLATVAVGGDTLPVVLQLGALVVVTKSNRPAAAAGAGVLCGLAILSKETALWAPAAIIVWLVARDRGRVAVATAGALVATLAVGLVAAEAVSHGRFADNVFGLSGSSFEGVGSVFVDSPGKLLGLAQAHGSSVVIVVPLALAGFVLAVLERRPTLYHLSFVFALAILLVVLADPGAFYNHLLDVSVLAVILVGDLWKRSVGAATTTAGPVVILAVLAWALAVGYRADVKPAAAEAAKLVTGRLDRATYAKVPPAGTFRPDDRILSEDPYVPLSLGRRPLVLDAFMLLRTLREHPAWRRELIRRIDVRRFDKVVLIHRLDRSGWWRDVHFGLPVVDAIRANYTLWRGPPDWRELWIYVPRRGTRSSAAG
jgi:Glycosyltransferase family 87